MVKIKSAYAMHDTRLAKLALMTGILKLAKSSWTTRTWLSAGKTEYVEKIIFLDSKSLEIIWRTE